MDALPNSTKPLKQTPVLLKLFQNIQRETALLNSLYEVGISLIPKPGKYTTHKESYGPISLINTDPNAFHQSHANQIQEYVKKIIYISLTW